MNNKRRVIPLAVLTAVIAWDLMGGLAGLQRLLRGWPADDGCLSCDLYAVIDRHGDTGSDFVADLVSVLPPRGHAFHKELGVCAWLYRSPAEDSNDD